MSTLEVNSIDKESGSTLTLGTSGTTVDVPSGATLDVTGATVSGLTTGSLVKLSTATFSDSASSIDFDNIFTSTYDVYFITYKGLSNVTTNQELYIQLGTSGWSSIPNHASQTFFVYANNSNGTMTYTSTTTGTLFAPYSNNSGDQANGGFMYIYGPTDSSMATRMHGMNNGYADNTATYTQTHWGGNITTNSAEVSIRFKAGTGNIGLNTVTGRITVYGVAH